VAAGDAEAARREYQVDGKQYMSVAVQGGNTRETTCLQFAGDSNKILPPASR